MEFCVKLLSLPLWERGLKWFQKSYVKLGGYSSLPLWERGLKSLLVLRLRGLPIVAPLVGAWIEMHRFHSCCAWAASLPLWERGLKYHFICGINIVRIKSLPLWERGLKYVLDTPLILIPWVAPLVGAWIEILLLPRPRYVIHVAPLVGAWIEIKINS